MATSRIQRLISYATKRKHQCPIVTLTYPKISNANTIYPQCQWISNAVILQNAKQLRGVRIQSIAIENDFSYDFMRFDTKTETKATVTEWIHRVVLKPSWQKPRYYTPVALATILKSASLSDFIFLRARENNNPNNVLFLMICKKTMNDRRPKNKGGNTVKGEKLDMQLFLSLHDYKRKNIVEQLQLFYFCQCLIEFAESLSNVECVGDTCAAYYYAVSYKNEGHFAKDIKNFRLTADSEPIDARIDATEMSAYLRYDPKRKPIPNIDQFRNDHAINLSDFKMPLVKRYLRNVIPLQLAESFYEKHRQHVFSGNGCHEFCPTRPSKSNQAFSRCKSYFIFKYLYNSKFYAERNRQFEKLNGSKSKIAARNVGAGLRYIGDDFELPEYVSQLIEFLRCIGLVHPTRKYDQISINWYQRSPKIKKYRRVGHAKIGSHFECDKFKTLEQVNIGRSSILSFDVAGETVNGLCGLEIDENSYISYDMRSYFFGAQMTQSSGGKHCVIERNMAFRHGQFRIAIMLRTCHPDMKAEALKHYKVCKNNDADCKCMQNS